MVAITAVSPAQTFTTSAANTRTDSDVRKSYNEKITQKYESEFKGTFASFHEKEMCFGDEVARAAFEARHTIKEAHQGETSFFGKVAIGVHNLAKYGSWSNPDYDYFIAQGKTPEEIAYSAFKTDGSDLGLENNGFGEVLKVWQALKSEHNVYPEEISSETVACFKEKAGNSLNKDSVLAYADQCVLPQETSAPSFFSVKV